MSEAKLTNAVFKITEEQSDQLRELLETRGWEFSGIPYARWKAAGPKINVISYLSGKLTVQGGGAREFIEFTLEPEILGEFSFTMAEAGKEELPEEVVEPHCGTDESGKGDFFGPLVIASVYADAVSGKALRELGACDSKLIKSSRKIYELADKIRSVTSGHWSVVTLMPATYNRLYSQIGNLNRLLAWGHARAIENVLEKVPDCPRALSDKFGDEHLIKRALLTRGRAIQLDQRTKAESDVAVAAASILAREGFLRGIAKLEENYGVVFPRGAGSQVNDAARKLLAEKGKEPFEYCAKLHFKTWSELVSAPEK